MLCKIATASQIAEPVAWRTLDGEGAPPRRPAPRPFVPSTQAEPRPAAPQPAAPDLEQRRAEAESTRKAEVAYARQNGFDEGIRKGREESAAELQRTLDQLAHTIQDLSQQKRKVRKDAESELVLLSIAVARRILHRELRADPESIQAIVYAAIKKLQNRESSRVRVYAAGAPAVRAAMERIGQRTAVDVVSDPALPNGAIFFETAVGELDASIETQLQEIERGFADRLSLT